MGSSSSGMSAISNAPFSSVIAENDVSVTITVAPITGSPVSSVTRPTTVRVVGAGIASPVSVVGDPTITTTAPLVAGTSTIAAGLPGASTCTTTSVAGTPGIEKVPSSSVTVLRLTSRTITTAPGTGLRSPSTTTPEITRVSGGGGGGVRASTTW